MDVIDLLPLGLTLVVCLAAWLAAMALDPRVAAPTDDRTLAEGSERSWFVE